MLNFRQYIYKEDKTYFKRPKILALNNNARLTNKVLKNLSLILDFSLKKF